MDSVIKVHYCLGGWFILNIRVRREYSVYSLRLQLCEKDKMQGRPLAQRNGRVPKLYHMMSKFAHNKEEWQTKNMKSSWKPNSNETEIRRGECCPLTV